MRRWRLWIAAATFLNALGLTAHIALACGFAAPFYSGFAQANDVLDLRVQLSDANVARAKERITELMTLMLDAKQNQCNSVGATKSLYLLTYNNLRAEYFDLIKREFPDPDCDEFK